jgi:deoxyribodipyrimidine photo-lyase
MTPNPADRTARARMFAVRTIDRFWGLVGESNVEALERLLAPNPRQRTLRGGSPAPEGRSVLYWMQRAQRGVDNPALDLAIAAGNLLERPVLAVFGLTADYPKAQRRHYRFLIDGLHDAKRDLGDRGVELVVRLGRPDQVVAAVAHEAQAALVVGDENPVRVGRIWRENLAERLSVPFYLVDADVVVPTSLFPREEYAARTIRPKIHRVWDEYLKPLPCAKSRFAWLHPRPEGAAIETEALLSALKVGGAAEVAGYTGGTDEAMRRLRRFVRERLPDYLTLRNQPAPSFASELSAHLHFGQISPLTIALEVLASDAPRDSVDAYLEELIVRRELAINFVARNPHYDSLAGCPLWARRTLAEHAGDSRPFIYSDRVLEAARTHDPLWNAAQKEMVLTGRMHNYLRMYWAKKILEWTESPEAAYGIALDLNDRYEMDGRDPSGYAGVAWALGGKHDRPWPARPIFGTIRYMSSEGARRKFDAVAYMNRVNAIENGTSPVVG